MKKVMLIAPDFNQYTQIFSDSIMQCGYDVRAMSFTPYNWKTAILKMLHMDDKKLINREIVAFNYEIKKNYKEYRPDFVIIIRGDFMCSDTLEQMHVKKVLWLYDSVSRYPDSARNWDAYDLHYVFEESDIEVLAKSGKQAEFLALGYDPKKYFPINAVKQDVDISFVGAMYGERKELLEKLADEFSDLHIEFYGIYVFKRYIFDYIQFIFSNKKKAFKNKAVSHKDANKLYARSKININILHRQSKSGWNARLNEILGAQGFQIISFNPLVADRYKGMLDTFTDYEELKKKIRYYLNHEEERKKIAAAGYVWTKKHETYKSRFEYIMARLESL